MWVFFEGAMPQNCSECGQFRWDISLQSEVCRIAEALGNGGIFQSKNEGIDSRPSWCPLVEAPTEVYDELAKRFAKKLLWGRRST